MSTKKLQIVSYTVKQAENADTIDGKHADEFAMSEDVKNLQQLVGDTPVSEQIKSYTDNSVAQKAAVQFITWEEND